MNTLELQRWLGAHGQPVVPDGLCGSKTRAAIVAAFTNDCAPAITETEITALADRLGCSPKQLKAVARVESGGAGFDAHGRPKILFERHIFHRLTDGAWTPTIYSNPSGGGYNMDSWEKLAFAACKDADAAFSSASWGKFQIMGMHWSSLGYPSPIDMAYATVTGEGSHYDMLARFIEKNGLKRALAQLSTNAADNVAFASKYNGPAFRRFSYDTKLAEAMA